MTETTIDLSSELLLRLQEISKRLEKTTAECLVLAVEEFLDGWESYLASVEAVESSEARPSLKIVND